VGPPDAKRRPGQGAPPTTTVHQSDDVKTDDSDLLCEVIDLVGHLSDRIVDVELRLAALGVPHAPSALDRQRARSRALAAESSPVARFVVQREEVLG
jgi:hypothetical protein